jgi:hypothetical protein
MALNTGDGLKGRAFAAGIPGMMGIPGHAPHLAMAPQPGAGEPDPKRAKADSGLVPEDAFAAQVCFRFVS